MLPALTIRLNEAIKQNFNLDEWRTLSKNWRKTHCNKILKTSQIFNIFISCCLAIGDSKVSARTHFAVAGAGAGCDGHPDCGGKKLHNFHNVQPNRAR